MATIDLGSVAIYAEDFGVKKSGSNPKKVVKWHQSLFGPACLGVARFSPNGQCFKANQDLCHMLGYDRTHLQRKTMEEITHPDDWAHQKKLLETMVNGNQEGYSIDKRCICRSGLPLWVRETASAVRDDSGAYLYSIVLFEVNERKDIEELFQLTLDLSSDAMVIADGRGEIVLVNSSTEKVFGYRRSELLGKTMDLLLPSFLRARPCLTFGKSQMELMKEKRNPVVRRKDGTYFPAEIGVSEIEMGRGTWTLNVIVDLSEHKHKREERFLDVGIAS